MKTVSITINGAVIKVYNHDAVTGIPRYVEPASVDVVVTSPPYNIGIRYSEYDDTISRKKYLNWTESWLGVVNDALSPDGSLFLNIGSKPSDPLVPFQVLDTALKFFKLQNVIHWIKSIHIPEEAVGKYGILKGDLTVGHYKPVNSPRFVNDCHEYIFHLTKTGRVPLDRLAIGVPYQDKSNTNRWGSGSSGLHCRGNTWFIPYKTIKNRRKDRPHPASYPVALASMCIKLHGVTRCRHVMDPFNGIGNTALAAASLGRTFTGFEIDSEYMVETEKRLRANPGEIL